MRWVQVILLALILASLAMVSLLCLGAHSPLAMRGGARPAAGAAISLAVYGVAMLAAHRLVHSRRAYAVGFLSGIIGGALQVVHLSLEEFGMHFGERMGVTLVFMGVSFAVWGAAALRVGRSGGTPGEALFASVFSAATTMVVAVAYGIGLAAVGFPDPGYVRTWPEFAASGWGDARAFAIANTFDAAASHFVVGPVVGILVGGIGVLISLAWRKSHRSATGAPLA